MEIAIERTKNLKNDEAKNEEAYSKIQSITDTY